MVDDKLIMATFSSPRFRGIESLSLERCSAISSKSLRCLMENCMNLKMLLLTGCSGIDGEAVMEMVEALPLLQKLELHHCGLDPKIAIELLRIRPNLDLGFFWLVRRSYISMHGSLFVCSLLWLLLL